VLLVNLASGDTVTFDFDDPVARAKWEEFRRSQYTDITGMALKIDGVQYALPLPRKRFERVYCDAGPVEHWDKSGRIIGDRLIVFADDIVATVLCYRSDRPRMVRFSIERLGRPVYLPGLEGGDPCT